MFILNLTVLFKKIKKCITFVKFNVMIVVTLVVNIVLLLFLKDQCISTLEGLGFRVGQSLIER